MPKADAEQAINSVLSQTTDETKQVELGDLLSHIDLLSDESLARVKAGQPPHFIVAYRGRQGIGRSVGHLHM